MKSKISILIFLSSLLSFQSIFEAKACGYFETAAETQMMMFRAQLPNMQALQMFYYTPDLYYSIEPDPQQNDRFRNCVEWQDQLGKSVSWDDIYVILYKTDPYEFIDAYDHKNLKIIYPKNTFIEQLSSSGNKDLMNYLLFAKKVEATEQQISSGRFESWNYDDNDETNPKSRAAQKGKYYTEASECLKKLKNSFLKERYAYQVCRLGYQLKKYNQVEQIYDAYFKELKPKSRLMSVWSLLFKALSVDALGQKQEANQLYAQVFDNCDEKKFRCIQMFNFGDSIPSDIDAHLQSVMYTMKIINYPGRALDSLKIIYHLNAKSEYLPFLVMREINKLEDWILTPEYYSSNYNAGYRCYLNKQYPEPEMNEQTTENLLTDLQYLDNLKSFVKILRKNAPQAEKDFYSIALAHLSLMQENNGDTQEYLSAVTEKAAPGILLQKELENSWLAIHTRDISDPAFKDYFIKNIGTLQNISVKNFDNSKMLYSLTLRLSKEYLKKNDIVTGNLLQMKSEYFRTANQEYNYIGYYQSIQQFDLNASVADIDRLIDLLSKNKKSNFELFLCEQPMGSIDVYKDLKGTLAFRENDLKTAYETFASMSQDFWETYPFADYLNEDPFFPKGLKKKRDFTYRFNKTDFVKTLLDLEEEATKDKKQQASNWLKLGNAFFNCTYWGNSWLMANYGQSVADIHFEEPDCASEWKLKNYYTCDLAASYYKKALKANASDEQKAFATLMLYRCNFLKHFYSDTYYEEEKEAAREYALAFQSTFKKTKTFKDFQCPGITNFLAGKMPKKQWW